MSRVEKYQQAEPTQKDKSTEKNNNKKEKNNKKKMATWKKVLIAIITFILVCIIGVAIYVGVIISKAPDINVSGIEKLLAQSTTIYDDQGKEIENIYTNTNRDNVSEKEISYKVKNAFIALEDKTFETHHGFNFIRIMGAIKDSVFGGGSVSGTSTITQQLARNVYLKDSRYEHSMKRKVIEAYYTVIIEKNLSKDKILTAYLNAVPFGYRCSGVEAASQAYFSKSAKDLTLAESAALAALPQAPSKFQLVEFIKDGNPEQYKDTLLKDTPEGVYVINDASKKRRELCLDLMKEQGFISAKECEKAKSVKLKDMLNPKYPSEHSDNSYFVDFLINEVVRDLVKSGATEKEAWDAVYNGGLRIHSTLDTQAQNVVYKEINNSYNYPSLNYNVDEYGNMIRSNGNIALYSYRNLVNSKGDYVLGANTVIKNKKGDLIFKKNAMVNVFETKVNGKKDYSLELKSMYLRENGLVYSIAGGFINVPSEYKTKDSEGNLVVSHKFLEQKDNQGKFKFDANGRLLISPKAYTMKAKVPQPQAAMTIVENKTGYIKAMQGGRGISGRTILNRAIEPRQPGSSIKPVAVYGPAIQQSVEEVNAGKKHKFVDTRAKGIDHQGKKYYGDYLTPGSIIVDEPMHIEGKEWPKNFERSYMGPLSMRKSMAYSRNTTSVKTLIQIGPEYSIKMLKKFGYKHLADSDQNYAALALGGMSQGVTTLEAASAYTTFVNEGKRVEPVSYTKIENKQGKIILQTEKKDIKVMDKGAAWIMTNMLQSVPIMGEAGGARMSNVKVGGKTGTTDDLNDIWFDGVTPRYSASIWIGCDANIPLTRHSDVAANFWGTIMRQIPSANVGTYPEKPSNVVRKNGEYYIKGTEKNVFHYNKNKEDAQYTICTDTGLLATDKCPHKKVINNYFGLKPKPKYYCPVHNDDIEKYPIDKKSIEQWKKDHDKEDDKEDSQTSDSSSENEDDTEASDSNKPVEQPVEEERK